MSYQQAVHKWFCHIEDCGFYKNDDSIPNRLLSIEKKTIWILKNQFGVLCPVDKKTGKVL